MEINQHKVEHRLIDKNENVLWFKIYVIEEIKNYDERLKLVIDKLKQLPEYTDLLCIVLIIRSVFKEYTENTLEVKIENEEMKQYIEYIDKDIYALEDYKFDKSNYENNEFEIYSKINNDYIENKSRRFQKEYEDLKSPEIIKLERTRKKEIS